MYVHKWVHTGRGHMEFTGIIHVQSINSYFACLLEQGANGSIRLQNKILQEWRYSAINLVHNSTEGASLAYSEWLKLDLRNTLTEYSCLVEPGPFFWDYQKEDHSCVVLPVKINSLLRVFAPSTSSVKSWRVLFFFFFFVGAVCIYLLSDAENNLDSPSI